MNELATSHRRLPALWADSAKVYAIGAFIVAIPAGVVGILSFRDFPRDEFGFSGIAAAVIGVALVCCLVIAPLMAVSAYRVVQNVRPAWRRAAVGGSILIVGTVVWFVPLIFTGTVLQCFAPMVVALAVWSVAFFLLCREKPISAVISARPGGGRISLAENRGGYDSYEPDAALRQARARGELALADRLMGVPGSPTELLRLAILIALIAAVTGAVLYGVASFLRLPLGLPIAIVVSLFAALFGGWLANRLVRVYRAPWARALAWGLSAAAGFLISLRLVLGLVLAAKFRLDGVGADEAGVRAFHGAAWFTLMVAMPAWAICVVWGLARRRQLDARPPAQLWRRGLPVVFIAAVMIFMAREGAYMDSLTQR